RASHHCKVAVTAIHRWILLVSRTTLILRRAWGRAFSLAPIARMIASDAGAAKRTFQRPRAHASDRPAAWKNRRSSGDRNPPAPAAPGAGCRDSRARLWG